MKGYEHNQGEIEHAQILQEKLCRLTEMKEFVSWVDRSEELFVLDTEMNMANSNSNYAVSSCQGCGCASCGGGGGSCRASGINEGVSK
jgi:hypothetical protein